MVQESAAVSASPFRRYVEASAFLTIWMLIGLLLKLSVNAYLLLGVPLSLLFQTLVRKRPMADLWVRDAPRVRLDQFGYLLVLLLASYPLLQLVQGFTTRERHGLIYFSARSLAILSTIPAAFAFRNLVSKEHWKDLSLCLLITGGLGTAMFVSLFLMEHHAPRSLAAILLEGVRSFLFYIPWMFLIEEVSFRGLIDAHVHRPGERKGILSAIFVSASWGVWHYPIVSPHDPRNVPGLIFVHCLLGLPLSIFWRRSGNLAVPVVAHAFVDSVRNALGF